MKRCLIPCAPFVFLEPPVDRGSANRANPEERPDTQTSKHTPTNIAFPCIGFVPCPSFSNTPFSLLPKNKPPKLPNEIEKQKKRQKRANQTGHAEHVTNRKQNATGQSVQGDRRSSPVRYGAVWFLRPASCVLRPHQNLEEALSRDPAVLHSLSLGQA